MSFLTKYKLQRGKKLYRFDKNRFYTGLVLRQFLAKWKIFDTFFEVWKVIWLKSIEKWIFCTSLIELIWLRKWHFGIWAYFSKKEIGSYEKLQKIANIILNFLEFFSFCFSCYISETYFFNKFPFLFFAKSKQKYQNYIL